MTLAELGSIGELVGALGVILSLIFVGIQVKRNTAMLQTASRETSTNRTIDTTRFLAADPEIARLFLKGSQNYEALDLEERFRFGMLLYSLMSDWNDQYVKHLDGVMEDETWEANLENLRVTLSSPGVCAWLNTLENSIPGRFEALLRREFPEVFTREIRR